MSNEKLWRFIGWRTIQEDGHAPRQMEEEFLIPGATLAEAWLLFEEKSSQYEYIQAMEYNPAMAVI